MSLSSGEKLGHYRISSLIGKGGMGEVYQAFDTQLERDVAIKVLPRSLAQDPERLARFHREAKILAALNHPNIATVHGVIESAGQFALVMELVPGQTLTGLIQRGAVPAPVAMKISRQIAEALEAAHEKNVVHRDLKPGNVMLTPSGLVKVLDFGLATITHAAPAPASNPSESPTQTLATLAGTILGTAAYMSPEQAEGLPADRRSDIWSFGVVLWEMLTGQHLFDAPSASRTLADVLRKEIDFSQIPGTTPPALQSLVRRCLDRETKNRLRDIGEARIAMDTADDPVAIPSPPANRPPILAWATALLFALAFGALAFVHFQQSHPQPPRLKVQISPPEGQGVTFRLSPDGRFVAIIVGEAFTRKIWIRPLDSLETNLLTDVPGGIAFWSRDSQSIAFHSGDGKLYKIPRGGGTPVLLSDLPPDVTGGVWLDDGNILITTSKGVFRVNASSAAPSQPALVFEQGGRAPDCLPGGRFVFTRPEGLFAGSVQGGTPTQILQEAPSAAYVPPAKSGLPGHLLFVRGGVLLAQPFNADKLEKQGEALPVPTGERGSNTGGLQDGAFSASANGILAFRRGNVSDVTLTWLDRSGRKLQSISKPFNMVRNPTIRLSPNDTQAIVQIPGNSGPDLWLADFGRETLSRFTFEGAHGGHWSADGRRIIWTDQKGSFFSQPTDGSGKRELLFHHPNCPTCLTYDWSRDGKLATFGGRNGTKYNSWIAATTGNAAKPAPYRESRFNEFYAMFSPDGRWVAYNSDESGQNQIYIESLPAGNGRRQVSTEDSQWPIWRHDGKELYFRQNNKIMAVPVHLSATSVDAGKPQPLFEVAPGTRFQVSRDGQRFLIAMPVDPSAASMQFTLDTDWRAGLTK